MFRRDLRISDNIGRIEASKASKTVVPLFVFDRDKEREIRTLVRMRSSSWSKKLVDDPAVNNGNWQWCASTGRDAQPYFRIFNPWLQQRRYDPDCTYIKAWIPELQAIAHALVHSLDNFKDKAIPGYPAPIVDHLAESSRAKEASRKIATGL
ncbi:MAG: FAD-binding domain-containing protein [Halobacteriota archaeon]